MTDGSQPHVGEHGKLRTEDGEVLAYRHTPGRSPGVIFCGGYASDMTGTKAETLEAHVVARGHQFTRFDYRGHGTSSGAFADGTIGTWSGDALAVFDKVTSGPQIVVGSSMGGWIMILLALARPERLAGLIGIAAAPDFTEDLMWGTFDDAIKETLTKTGIYREPSPYSDTPTIVTMNLIEEGRSHLVLRAPIPITVPTRLLHGMRDPDVPYTLSATLAERIETDDVRILLIKDGDHRLSTDRDLRLLRDTVDELLEGGLQA
jgi:pimeloyl-ACP methyl ester carboxylesterase